MRKAPTVTKWRKEETKWRKKKQLQQWAHEKGDGLRDEINRCQRIRLLFTQSGLNRIFININQSINCYEFYLLSTCLSILFHHQFRGESKRRAVQNDENESVSAIQNGRTKKTKKKKQEMCAELKRKLHRSVWFDVYEDEMYNKNPSICWNIHVDPWFSIDNVHFPSNRPIKLLWEYSSSHGLLESRERKKSPFRIHKC